MVTAVSAGLPYRSPDRRSSPMGGHPAALGPPL